MQVSKCEICLNFGLESYFLFTKSYAASEFGPLFPLSDAIVEEQRVPDGEIAFRFGKRGVRNEGSDR
jgi:hypothetical protein